MKHRRNRIRSYQHFIWTPHDRLPMVTGDIEREVYRYIEVVCRRSGCEVLALNGMPDHVHLLVVFPATLTYADLMQRVKGGSSRFISDELRSDEWFAWRVNYGVFSVSPADKQRTIRYIEDQKRHHAEGTLWSGVEDFDKDQDEESELT